MPLSTILDTVSNARGLSGAIFKDLPYEENALPNSAGWFWHEDFLQGVTVDSAASLITPKSTWTITQVTAGTVAITPGSLCQGLLTIDSGSTTSGQGINLQGGPQVIPSAGLIIGMEWRMNWTAMATPPQFLCGLSDNATAALTGGATLVVNTTNVVDAVAFTNVASNATSTAITSYNDETGESAVLSSSLHTAVSGVDFKLGIRIEGLDRVKYYVNGALMHTHAASAGTIPTVAMQPIIVCQTDGTTQPTIVLDSVSMACGY